MPKYQTDYSKTIIYKICCKDPNITDIYIGHTTNFIKRKNNHKTMCYNINNNVYIYTFIRSCGGWDNWSMIPLEEFNCNNNIEALIRERYWIDLLKPKLNCIYPITSKEEKKSQKKNWYEEKKDYVLEKAKKNYEENKEEKIEYQKEYAQENKEKISEYQKEYIEKNKEKLKEQKKEYRAIHKEASAKAQKDWREANKERLKEKRNQIIQCECEHSYKFGNKNKHFKSKIHLLYYEKINNPEKFCQEIREEEMLKQKEEKRLKLNQQQKKYRETHKEQIQQYKKKHYETHKKEVSDKYKIYREQNKEKITEQQKIYIEENKEKIREKKNEWYQNNKEKILEKHKELFICECGSEIRKSGIREHNNSTKHQQFILLNKCI